MLMLRLGVVAAVTAMAAPIVVAMLMVLPVLILIGLLMWCPC